MRAGQAAAAAGVTVKALRYYEGLGLLRPLRGSNGYRDYRTADVRAAAQIRELMAFGLSTSETAPFLACLDAGHAAGDDCLESIAAYQRKLDQLDGVIARLSSVRAQLHGRMCAAAMRGFTSTGSIHPGTDMRLPRADPLPTGLPAPVDDGAVRHLPGRTLPPLELPATDGSTVRLDRVARGRWVLFVYPLTGEPGVDVPRGWNEIPGARGCSQEACGFRDNLRKLEQAGVGQVVALSTDPIRYQQELAVRLHLPYRLLSDPGLSVADALELPTFTAPTAGHDSIGGQRLYKRLTLVLDGSVIEHVFYPVFPPDRHADEVLDWVRHHPLARPGARTADDGGRRGHGVA
jgi:peroxiredoxin/DNA-binding transcriptional MerR regulator